MSFETEVIISARILIEQKELRDRSGNRQICHAREKTEIRDSPFRCRYTVTHGSLVIWLTGGADVADFALQIVAQETKSAAALACGKALLPIGGSNCPVAR